METKTSPPCCKLKHCQFNLLDPPFNSQECYKCPRLKNKDWRPTMKGEK